jgi:5-formyltetrahydrofolate cyclo-ligase
MEKLKPQTLLEEIREIRNELRKVSAIIEARLIGVEIPTKEEIKAIREFEARRKRGKIKLIPLSKIK